MQDPIIVNIKCQHYLICFLIKHYGPMPVKFPAMSDPNRLLGKLIAVAPLNHVQENYGENTLSVVLPQFRYKDITLYHYLSERKQKMIENYIHGWFKVVFHIEMNNYITLGYKRKDSIFLFMDTYEMPEQCFDALLKDYNRYMVTVSKYGEKKSRNVLNYPTLLSENEPEEISESL
ncbi:MAG: hypothetical protein ACOYNC_14915 [Bacteroidales bacterium]